MAYEAYKDSYILSIVFHRREKTYHGFPVKSGVLYVTYSGLPCHSPDKIGSVRAIRLKALGCMAHTILIYKPYVIEASIGFHNGQGGEKILILGCKVVTISKGKGFDQSLVALEFFRQESLFFVGGLLQKLH